MDGGILATMTAILNILWVLPIGYFTVMDVVKR